MANYWEVLQRKEEDGGGFGLFASRDVYHNIRRLDLSAFQHLEFSRFQYDALASEFPKFFEHVQNSGYYIPDFDAVILIVGSEKRTPLSMSVVNHIITDPGRELSGRISKMATIPWKAPYTKIPVSEWMEVGKSTVCDGKGLIAKQNIPKGTVYFSIHEQPHLRINPFVYSGLKANYADFADRIDHFGFYLPSFNLIFFMLDYSRFMNHSTNPTGEIVDEERVWVATTRDVAAGEELFENYYGYIDCPWATLYKDLDFA